MILEVLLELLYILVVGVIWLMILYQVVLAFGGYFYSRRRSAGASVPDEDLPLVSVIIPARNEEEVIAETAACMLRLDYPKDKFELIIVNDGSTDRTRAILEGVQDPRLTVINIPLEESGQGKSRVLNLAVQRAKGDYIAIYDADNRPESGALKLLVRELLASPGFIATIGKFRAVNKARSIVTRFVNIESLTFQWIIQAGRSFFFDIAILPGTNFVIEKKAVLAVGGWDTGALTEDAELSLRLYKAGGKIKFVPKSITWEQEPESVKIWLKQRTRWVRGNNYVLTKVLQEYRHFKDRAIGFEFLGFHLMYYIFFVAMVLSDLFFVLGLLNIVNIGIQGPFLEVWIVAFMLFVSEIVLMLSRERGEDDATNILFVILMYFTYCQLWLVVVLNAFFKDVIKREKAVWYKTERTADAAPLPPKTQEG